ncbi:hypothetical protein GPECTOR_20g401 [Gonium pectorale]|uniref:Enoyl reductase (ER) domain-containing protein n=1 Tax=Gonium pectorale TaxID=33097 RepID=A0A150GIA2_GONPE|nr:hypothetical protein GPECTOR_20g401 [Gonium pectorale]|eukprot:KXZ49547.1 hypothetical protein GPECTOR_20g401 [Gonium pectorale]
MALPNTQTAIQVYPGFKPKDFPATLGLEGAGAVAALGPDVSGRLAVGQRVVAVNWRPAASGNGTWQQYLVLREEDLVPIPDDLPDELACQALINPIPVIGMLRELAPPKGEYVIVTAAGSALGRMTLSYAKSIGIRTIATARRAEQLEELKAAGADAAFQLASDADAAALAEGVMALTGGRGAWGAIDAVAGPVPAWIAPAVRENGAIILYGLMSGVEVPYSGIQLLFRRVGLQGFWLVPWLEAQPLEAQREVLGAAVEALRSGVLQSPKIEKRPLEEAAAALADQSKVGREAKIVLVG